jgi:hypothetical protein
LQDGQPEEARRTLARTATMLRDFAVRGSVADLAPTGDPSGLILLDVHGHPLGTIESVARGPDGNVQIVSRVGGILGTGGRVVTVTAPVVLFGRHYAVAATDSMGAP